MGKRAKAKVQVWIYDQRPGGGLDVLILMTTAERGAFWQPVTGSVEEGESLEQAALREAWEETGFTYAKETLRPLGKPFTFKDRWENDVTEQAFSLRAPKGRPKPTLDPKEHTDSRWTSAEDALQKLKFAGNAELLRELMRGVE